MKSSTHLWLIRHAEVEQSYQKVFGGRIDMNISERGHEQSAALAQWLERPPIEFIYASPMKRVQQTLAPTLLRHAHSPVILPDLREVDFGDWTGHSWDSIQEKFGVSAFTWLDQLETGTIQNAETAAGYRGRVEPCVRQILEEQTGRNVAVFCHGGVIRMILSILLDLPLRKMGSFEIDYASVTKVSLFPHKIEAQFLNFAPWREVLP